MIDYTLFSLGEMFHVALKIASPILFSTLIVGLLVSVIQVVTQIQEMTLTFVPKILVSLAVLGMMGHWMLSQLIEFTTSLFTQIATF
ncbi:flagellar biosynthetic protein FliQ [Colwellia sp. MEBiC06753]